MLIRKLPNIKAIALDDHRPKAVVIAVLLISAVFGLAVFGFAVIGMMASPLYAQSPQPLNHTSALALQSSNLTSLSNADIFYLRASKLEKLGVRAPFDADFQPLISQAKKSYRSAELQNKSASKRGKPLYCNVRDERLTPREVLSELRKIPKIKRQRMSLTRAFLLIAQKRYPC